MNSLSISLIIALPFLAGLSIAILPMRWRSAYGLVVLIESLLVFGIAASLWSSVSDGSSYSVSFPWVPSLHIQASFLLDRLSVFIVALVGLVGAAIAQYARVYFKDQGSRRFWILLSIFQGAMVGIPLSDSLLLFFIFWEMTTVTSALLIALDDKNKAARAAAIQGFIVTGFGGLCLLAGIVLLGQLAGTYEFSKLRLLGSELVKADVHQPALALMLIGAFTKSAQFPFHFWLPGAMAAPTPISAYLHSATMVKAGIILMSRMFPIFSGSPLWEPILGTVGLVTFMLASWNAFRAADMKKILAHSTVSYLGLLTTIYGYSHGRQVQGELLHIANHTFYKAALFLLLGWFEKVSGTRDINLLDQEIWFRRQPLGALLFIIAGLAIVGGPFLLGYTSKALFYDVVLASAHTLWSPFFIMVGSCLTVAYTMKLIVATFWGDHEPETRVNSEVKVSFWLILLPLLLLLPQILGGIFPAFISKVFSEPPYEWSGGLAFWQALDVKNLMKISIFVLGGCLYFQWRRANRWPLKKGLDDFASEFALLTLRLSTRVGDSLQKGLSFSTQMGLILWACLIFVACLMPWTVDMNLLQGFRSEESANLHFLIPAALIIGSTLALLWVDKKITILLLMAMSSYGLALAFVFFRAPDLALTQFLADTVGMIVMLLILFAMGGSTSTLKPSSSRAAAALVSLCTGIGVGLLVYLASFQKQLERVGIQHLRLALPEAKGTNVVNTILVDFRAADTLGEIIVLALAALGVMALVKSNSTQALSTKGWDPQSTRRSLMLERAVTILLPVTLIFSVYLLFRGHYEPGGGFIAALVSAMALIMHTLAFGVQATRMQFLRAGPFLLWGGLVLSAISGFMALGWQQPYLTHFYDENLSTALVFDLGVFSAVLGTSLIIFASFAEKSS